MLEHTPAKRETIGNCGCGRPLYKVPGGVTHDIEDEDHHLEHFGGMQVRVPRPSLPAHAPSAPVERVHDVHPVPWGPKGPPPRPVMADLIGKIGEVLNRFSTRHRRYHALLGKCEHCGDTTRLEIVAEQAVLSKVGFESQRACMNPACGYCDRSALLHLTRGLDALEG